MAQVSLKNVSKVFPGNVVAVNDVSLGVENKEFMVLLGPSGCGKSTTLRIIAGLEDATSGDVFIGNKMVNALPPKDRDIAMVFQNYALYPHMNVYNNMAFGLKLRKYPKSEIDKRIKEAAGILGLAKLLNRKPQELSGGQRQRLSIARAIYRDPEILILDEATSNIDADSEAKITQALREFTRGRTCLIVAHRLATVMAADSIVVMDQGRIVATGTHEELLVSCPLYRGLYETQFSAGPTNNST